MTDYSDLAMPDLAADYTITLGNLISLGYDNDEKLHLSPKYYPIFDERHRSDLNHKIIAHYAIREIGQETAEMFVFYLGRTMSEIMPYYNQLYESAQRKIEPFITTDIMAEANTSSVSQSSGKSSGLQDVKASGQNTSHSSTSVDATSFHSENPQTQSSFENNATTADRTKSNTVSDTSGESTSDNQSTSSSSTDYNHADDKGESKQHSRGYSGVSQSQLLTEWRGTMLNIDMMVVNELQSCFMGIWGTAEEMLHYRRPYTATERRI